MANIAGNMAWDVDNPGDIHDLKAYLGIDKADLSEDARLRAWFLSAIEKGDKYLDESYTDSAGADLPLPETVRVGVWEFVKAIREGYLREAGIRSAKTDRMAESYAKDGFGGMIGLKAALIWWFSEKNNPLTAGA